MSAFMCCPETIYDVARCVVYLGFPSNRYTDDGKSWYEVFGVKKKDDRRLQIKKVYYKLINLNILALKERYPDYESMLGDMDNYTDKPRADLNFKPEYKLAMEIGCFIYQCSEGKAAYTDEYDITSETYDILCHHLVDMECRNREAELSKYWA